MKVLFFVGEDNSFYNHRLLLATTFLQDGFEVRVATKHTNNKYLEAITRQNIKFYPLKFFHRASINPIKQLQTIFEIQQVIKEYAPDILINVGIKPIILGSFIGKICKINKIINNFGGLGYVFTNISSRDSFKKKLLRSIAIISLRILLNLRRITTVFQNNDDYTIFHQLKIIKQSTKTAIIHGNGINLDYYPITMPPQTNNIVISYIGRMLYDKGLQELVAACKLLQERTTTSFSLQLVGDIDTANPSCIQATTIQEWTQQDPHITWLGLQENIQEIIINSHIIVLPSYREGLPKALLEAASLMRPLITCDTAGCREVVVNNYNGFLVPVKSTIELAEAILTLMESEELQIKFGINGRKLIQEKFSIEKISQQFIDILDN